MLRKYRFQSAVVLFFIVMSIASVGTAHAQGIGVKIQPTTIEEQVDPGQVVEGVLTVTNENGGMQTYSFGTRNISGMEDSGRPIFGDIRFKDDLSAAEWIVPLKSEVSLDVGQSAEIPYRITIPESVSPGSYFGAIFVTRAAETTSENGASVGFNVASLVSLRVRGDAVEDVVFRELFTEKFFYTVPDVHFTARLENSGTVHERPLGIIEITDMLGNKAGQVSFNDTAGAIFPRTDRVFESAWSPEGFAFGKYTASASVVYGDAVRRTIVRDTSFWIVPLQEVGIVVGLVLVVLGVVFGGMRLYIRSAIRRAGVGVAAKAQTAANISFLRRFVRTTVWLVLLLLAVFFAVVLFFV